MIHSRTFILFVALVENFGNEDFHVPMGCFDGAVVCELVDSLILTKLCDVLQRENVKRGEIMTQSMCMKTLTIHRKC